jgi:hypothetical protein
MNKNEWKKLVLERDNNSCCRCNKNTSNIEVVFSNQNDTYEIRNGITICEECSKEYKTANGEKSDWWTWERFVNEKGRTLRRPIVTKK